MATSEPQSADAAPIGKGGGNRVFYESLFDDTRPFWEGRGLFATCFVALVATSFAFMIRVMVMQSWQIEFGLTETQKGEIFGAGMWPFGLSIILFSLFVDRLGYGKVLVFAFVCHVLSTIILLTAGGYGGLYAGSFLNGLAAGTVEAVINPAVASMYPRKKTKMLTILHAGWPAGFVVAGLFIMSMGGAMGWQPKVAIILIPTVIYGIMTIRSKFPVSERVAAGVSFKAMLAEPGAIGCLLVLYMIAMEVNRLFGLGNMIDTTFFDVPSLPATVLLIGLTGWYYWYCRSLGRPLYIMLLIVMVLLAITELGTDTWIKELMKPAMTNVGLDSGWVLIYTATIMTILRFCIGPIEKVLKPLGVLLVSSLFAACGLYFLSRAEGLMILIMATIYGTGQCFFWPVTQGLVAEQFPKGGALTVNAIGGMGMLGVGIIGAQLLGFWQDTNIDAQLEEIGQPEVYQRLMDDDAKQSIFGSYSALDGGYVNRVNDLIALQQFRKEWALERGTIEGVDADLTYQMLVRNAYNHLLRPVGDDSDKTHEQMAAALAESGMLLEEADTELTLLLADQGLITQVVNNAKRHAMASVAILPLIMACCYLGFILYFRSKGGYEPVELESGAGDEGEAPAAAA